MKIVLGDNPFFGVNHLAGSKVLENEALRFSDAASVIDSASRAGIDTFMISNHASANNLLEACAQRQIEVPDLALVLPVPSLYNDVVQQSGYWGLVKTLIPTALTSLPSLLYDLLLGNLSRSLVRVLVSYELTKIRLHRKKVSHLCLHNIIVDMFLAGGRTSFIESFVSECSRRNIEPVLITQNYPTLVSALGDGRYTACFSCNPSGYMVNPTLSDVERALDRRATQPNVKHRVWLMQVFASGSVTLDEFLEFSRRIRGIEAVVYATTKPARVTEFVAVCQSDLSP